MAVKKKKNDRTATKRVANHEKRKREAGLVSVSLKAWVRAEKEEEARKLLRDAKMKAELL